MSIDKVSRVKEFVTEDSVFSSVSWSIGSKFLIAWSKTHLPQMFGFTEETQLQFATTNFDVQNFIFVPSIPLKDKKYSEGQLVIRIDGSGKI